MNAQRLRRLDPDLERFTTRMLVDLGRQGQRYWAVNYVRGLLLDGLRKSIKPMARRLQALDRAKLGADYAQAVQQLICDSPWSAEKVCRRLEQWRAGQSRAGGQSLLIVDELGFQKQGDHSVGVARQRSSALGGMAHCQVVILLQHVRQDRTGRRGDVCPVAARLFLPREWTNDRRRMARAGVPPDAKFQPQWRIGLDMLQQAEAQGLDGIVVAEVGLGSFAGFRRALDSGGWKWCVALDGKVEVVDAAGSAAAPAELKISRKPLRRRGAERESGIPAAQWALNHRTEFRKVTFDRGRRGTLSSRWARWRVLPAHGASGSSSAPEFWLLAQWIEDEDLPGKFWLSNLAEGTPLRELAQLAASAWWARRGRRRLIDDLKLDHFEGRSWHGLHHHLTLGMVAGGWLVHRAARRGYQLGK